MTEHMRMGRLERLLSLVTRVRPGEGRAALLFFLHAFLLLSSFQVIKAVRDGFILTRFSAETRSYVVALMALLLMFIVPLYALVRRHLDGARLLRVVTIFFVMTLPVFAVLAHFQAPIAIVFYVWVGIYGVMVVAQMWAFAADSFNVKTGQRLFVVIALGANLGALVGAKLTQVAVQALSSMGLLLIATCALGATLLLATPERAAVPAGSRCIPTDEKQHVPHLLGGIALVLRDRYLLLIAMFVVLLNWINSTGEFILAAYVKTHALAHMAAIGGDEEALRTYISAFMANFYFWVTLIGLAIQLLLVARVYRLMGMRGALLVHPVIVAVGYGLLAFSPMLGGFIPLFSLIRRVKVADNGVDYSLMNTTRQALFLPVDRDSKYDGKMAIDTFFWRFGDLLMAGGVYVGLNLLVWDTHQFALFNLALALIWILLALAMGRSYSSKTLESMGNTAPEAVDPIPDLQCTPGVSFRHQVPPTAFLDADPGDVLMLHAICEDGKPLPRWLHFNGQQQFFFGTLPQHLEIEELRVVVIASDLDGLKARSTFMVRPLLPPAV
ncbi:MAG: Npt1/Npt2 family nucleotide transporter [Pseudomonadota bacterium]